MKTHENRALFSRALLKATTCLFLTAGAGVSSVWATPETTESMRTEMVQQQTVTVSGVVKDRKGEPIIGANIMEKGTTNGTITDFDGKYTLKVKSAQSVLTISYIGYKTQEIPVGNGGKKDITISVTSGVISFPVPDSCASINVRAVASVITTIGKNYGAINVYCVTLDNLDEFSKQRFFTVKDDSQGIYEEVNLGIFVNRIKRIFTNVPVSGTDSLRCGNYNTGITVQTPEKDVISLNFGDVTLTGLNGDSEDYNAQISVFIPCRGFVAIDSKYIGKTINLSFKVNVITGDAVAFLSCDGVVFQLESFSLSRDVIYKTGTKELNIVGGTQWDEQILYGLEPYVIITQNTTINKPVNNTQESVTIGDVTGYAQFENVDLDTVNLLVDEYNTIISELENGVYL